jgi:SPP1 gp7 family putative phage head morphogenesis protein
VSPYRISKTPTTIYEEEVSRRVRQSQMRHINQESLRLITNINTDMRQRIEEVLKLGISKGMSVSVIASKLLPTGLDKGVFRSSRKRAWLIAKTELHRARQSAALDCYRANEISRVKLVEIFDSKTCILCSSRNGRVYRLEDLTEEDIPPLHPRCRGRLLPENFNLSISSKDDSQNYMYVVRT